MGSYLSGIEHADNLKSTCPILGGLSLPKVREMHGNFKSICDNFAIGLAEFEIIFLSNQQTFGMFDTDNNGKIFRNLILL